MSDSIPSMTARISSVNRENPTSNSRREITPSPLASKFENKSKFSGTMVGRIDGTSDGESLGNGVPKEEKLPGSIAAPIPPLSVGDAVGAFVLGA